MTPFGWLVCVVGAAILYSLNVIFPPRLWWHALPFTMLGFCWGFACPWIFPRKR